MKNGLTLNVVLAGQANVGKSVIFNYFTGLHQHIGNWPGKTVEKKEGTLYYKGFTINFLDLPGIYSLTNYSAEEIVSRDCIAEQKPDFIVNVVDSTSLERNLLFTLQLLEMRKPMVLAMNMTDMAKKKGIEIDYRKLSELLGAPVIPTTGTKGKGLAEMLEKGIKMVKNQKNQKTPYFKYGKEVENRIQALTQALSGVNIGYDKRWLAIKLLEKDSAVKEMIKDRGILDKVKSLIRELEDIHGHCSSIIIADERCFAALRIIKQVATITKPKKTPLWEVLGDMTTNKIAGYPIMIAILFFTFFSIFKLGNWLSGLIGNISASWQEIWTSFFGISVWAGLGWSAIESAIALMALALPYILPFYLILFLLEDWGYLARVAFLTDTFMHKMGIHGKACIPLVLGLGCNVPACLSCRIMETGRERLITGFLVTFVPCSAVTIIIMGLVGKFVGVGWALGLYLLAIITIFVLGKIASKILPGEPTELIMTMPDYRFPNLKTVTLQTWFRLKEFIFIAGPFVIISGILISGANLAGWLSPISSVFKPITVGWLGLPAETGILLIFGLLRKELILLLLAVILGTANFADALTPVQMITLAIISMFYVPCVAVIAALWKEFGWEKTLVITLFKIVFAIVIAGLIARILTLFI